MESILKRAVRFAFSDYVSSYESLLYKANLTTLEVNRQRNIAIETFKILNGLAPEFLRDLFSTNNSRYNTRQCNNLMVPTVKTTTYGIHSIKYFAVKIWNELPKETVLSENLKDFKMKIKDWNGFNCKCYMCK